MPQSGYIPGTCNIGREEVAARKALFYMGLVAAVAVMVYLLLVPLSFFYLLLLFSISAFTSINFQQYRNRFCIKYGWRHQFNFGKRGEKENVTDETQRKADRKKVIEIIAKAILFAAIHVATIYFLLRWF